MSSVIKILLNSFLFWFFGIFLIFTKNSYETIKAVWFLIGSIFYLPVFYIYQIRNSYTFSDLAYFLWLISGLLSTVSAPDFVESLLGGNLRYQGLAFFFFLWVFRKTTKHLVKQNLFTNLLFAIILFESCLALIQKFFGVYILGTIGNTNSFLGFLMLSWFLILTTRNTKKIILNSLVILIVFLLVKNATSIIFFAITLFGVVAYFFKSARKILISTLILGGIGFVVFGTLKNSQVSLHENRGQLWQIAIAEIKKRPISGYGFESEDTIFNRAFRDINVPLEGITFDRSHNLILDLMLWTGMLGNLAFLSWFTCEVFLLYKTKKFINLLGVFVWFLFSMFHPVGIAHWVLLVILFS